jgi:hypothetical protein
VSRNLSGSSGPTFVASSVMPSASKKPSRRSRAPIRMW